MAQAPRGRKVFVGGLRDVTENRDLKDYFSRFGPVTSAVIVLDKITGNKRGFAFVEFENCESAERCCQQSQHLVNGKRCDVKMAVDNNSMGRGIQEDRKAFPDHFVSLQITNSEIKSNIAEVQKHILSRQPELSQAITPLATLHVSLMVIRLEGKEDHLNSIQKAMANCVSMAVKDALTPITISFEGLGNFGDSVLFAKVADGRARQQLKALAGVVRGCFTECGLPSTDVGREFEPHLTVMKIIRRGTQRIDPTSYASFITKPMGEQPITSLQLCAMGLPKNPNDYYSIVHQVPL
jgi:2'-5' RNA ligase